MKTSVFLLNILLPLLSQAEVLEGVAKNLNDNVIYLEKHQIEKDEKGLSKYIRVEYSRPDGTLFATMTSDFANSNTVPETTFEDTRFKSRSLIRLLSNSVEFEEIKIGRSIVKKKILLNNLMVASQGFDNFIKLNSSKMNTAPIDFEFGVLANRDFYKLTGYKLPASSSQEIEYRIRPSNWFISLIADELRVVYDSKSMKLKSFIGRSNISDDSGKPQDVVIQYKWKDSL